jgi:hypothetical protein
MSRNRARRLFISISTVAIGGIVAWAAMTTDSKPGTASHKFSDQPIWDDGLSEMCYYDAVDVIYGKPRSYTRVHLLNRQWMDERTGVKAGRDDGIGVFKLNISEEPPTENYNYRYLTTVFLKRPDLAPFKMAASSQEWCGTTYKHLRWGKDKLRVQSFSYFPDEGENDWRLESKSFPYEGLFVLVRHLAAANRDTALSILVPMRSNRQVEPKTQKASLRVADRTERISVPFGELESRKVTISWAEGVESFWVGVDAPYLLLKHEDSVGRGMALRFMERRPYWDRRSSSGFHRPGLAP